MRLDDFDYDLPPERIAHAPAAERSAARLLAHDVARASTEHRTVADLPALLAPGDLLVLNDTRVLPARLAARRRSGGAVELLLLQREPDGAWRALVRPAKRIAPGERLEVAPAGAALALERPRGEDGTVGAEWRVRLQPPDGEAEADWLERVGRMPLPPYIERPRGGADPAAELDRERYQTVFARAPGAVAAPTAGLHFTHALLDQLRGAGVAIAWVTLHVGAGTFEPVRAEHVEEHRMHAERFDLPADTARAVDACRARGGRVVAVGTTSARVLESRADGEGGVRPGAGETDLYLRPGSRFRAIDGLLTNFHLPRSTLLVLVCAYAGRERALGLYAEAVERGYRFFSYGDAMLLLGRPRD